MRFKMYKSGKTWVIGFTMVAGLLGMVVVGNQVSVADAADAVQQQSTNNGVQQLNGQLVDLINGVQQKSTFATDSSGNTYYFDANGKAVTGLQTIDGNQYYFGSDYTLQKNANFTTNGLDYTSDQNGVVTAKNGLIVSQQGTFYYANGLKVTNSWQTINGATYFFGSDGKAVTGIQVIGSDEYYFDSQSNILQTNFTNQKIDNVTFSADSQGKLTAKNGVIWGFGDSTTVGWNSYNDNSKSYDYYAAQNLDMQYLNNSAVSGTQIQADMGWMTDKAVADPLFQKATKIVIALGVNDINFGGTAPLNKLAEIFQDNIRRLHFTNTNAQIFILLPQGDYWQGKNNDSIGPGGFSMNQLKATLQEIGNNLGLTVIDAGVVTDDNHTQTIPDGVHPTNATYQLIGEKITSAIQNNPSNFIDNYQNYDLGSVSGYVNTMAGWRWVENGQIFTGFRSYMGTYYWFENGVRSNNAWHEAWGNNYYTGSDGRAVQGWQTIDGNRYYFGDDNTFYLRKNTLFNMNGGQFKSDNSGVVLPWSGYIYDGSADNGGYRWYENGQLFTGFRFYYGTYYWFVNGVRQNEGWRQAWGYTYWTNADGRAVQGWQTIDGKRYYFGEDGTYFLHKGQIFNINDQEYRSDDNSGELVPWSGYIWDGSQYNGGYRWYENGELFTGFRFYYGTYYWFVNGIRQNEGWRQAWGYTYWTNAEGRAVQGWQTIDGSRYYFGENNTYYLR